MKETIPNDSRLYPRLPIAGVGAVVINKERLLLVKRGNEPNKGKWSIPGGGIELGETIFEAAKREVLEECSVKVEIIRVLDAVDNIIRDDDGRIRYHYVIIDLLGDYVSGDIKAQSDAAACGWFTPDEVIGMDITPILRAMLERHGIIQSLEK
ncbi:MAG: NUDIX hydrolase [Dehalococcoidales bacterium]